MSRRPLEAWLILLAASAFAAGTVNAQVFEVDGGVVHQIGAVPSHLAPGKLPPSPSLLAAAATAGVRHGVAAELVDTVARQESGYRTNAKSRTGALGVMQLMPGTARALRVDARDPAANLEGGVTYLRAMLNRFDGRIDLALAAYNAGPAAVERFHGVPPYRETQAYVRAGLARLAQISLAAPSLVEVGSLP